MDSQTKNLLEKLSRYLPMCEIENASHIVRGGDGSWYTDVEGRRYLDFSSGIFTNSFGHGDAELARALTECFSTLANIHGRRWEGELEFCERLFRYLPGEDYRVVPFGDGGAYAVDRALAELYYRRGCETYRLAVFNQGFHGKTIAARTLLSHAETAFFLPSGIPAPYCYRCPCGKERASCQMECADLAISCMSRAKTEVFLMEPVLGSAVIAPPEGYWEELGRFCRSRGIALIADEVLVGGGRLGRYIVSQSFGLSPEVILLSKGLTNGLPQSLMLLKREIADHFLAQMMWHYSATYIWVPAMIALMTKVLEKIERESILENVLQRGVQLSNGLSEIQREYPERIGDVRGMGLMAAVEFVRDKRSRTPDYALGQAVFRQAEKNGLELIPGGHILRIGPPLNISEHDMALGINLLEKSIREVLYA